MNRKHILMVDDDVNTLRSMEFILEAADLEVTTGTNGEEALQTILSRQKARPPIDLLITDVQMGGLSGIQLIDELHRRNIFMPILVVTAYGESKLRKELAKRGCPHCLDKPFNDEDLIQTVFQILGKNGKGSDPLQMKNEPRSGGHHRRKDHDPED